jgi:hypothetical protein
MLATQSAQVGMFDAAVVMGPLPEGSFSALLAEHGDRIVRDQDFAECYGALASSIIQSRQTLAEFVEAEWWPRYARR